MRRHYQVIVRALLLLAFGICFLHVLATSTAYAKSAQVTFSLGPTGLAVQNGLLLVATRLNNTSDRNAFRAQIESISLSLACIDDEQEDEGHKYKGRKDEEDCPTGAVYPVSRVCFPIAVGEMDADQSAMGQATFNSGPLVQGQPYRLRVHGSYRRVNKGTQEEEGHEFTGSTNMVLPPPGPGSA